MNKPTFNLFMATICKFWGGITCLISKRIDKSISRPSMLSKCMESKTN